MSRQIGTGREAGADKDPERVLLDSSTAKSTRMCRVVPKKMMRDEPSLRSIRVSKRHDARAKKRATGAWQLDGPKVGPVSEHPRVPPLAALY